MLTPRLTSCRTCAEVPNLLATINCKIAEISLSLYQNITLMLSRPVDGSLIEDLLHYKRILTYKYCNPDYAVDYTIEKIASKVRSKTAGTNKACDSVVSIFTTTTTSTSTSTTTTTSTSSTTTTTTTTIAPFTAFNISTTTGHACLFPELSPYDQTYYHNGEGVYPTLGDLVYTDNGITLAVDILSPDHLQMANNDYLQTDVEGIVTSIQCK